MSCIGPTRNSPLVAYREVARRLGISEHEALRLGESALARLRRRLRNDARRRARILGLLGAKAELSDRRLLAAPHTNVYIEDPEA